MVGEFVHEDMGLIFSGGNGRENYEFQVQRVSFVLSA